ncbi:MAG: diaminopimelate decarboxylase, partial [Clostridia bacterium]|nr:diaminopimelate decarboxylase [Clostridia bacterium]
ATGVPAREISIGGGVGIRYTDEDLPPDVTEVVAASAAARDTAAAREGLPRPLLVLEPGRSVVGEAGVTLYTVGSSKRVEGLRHFVAVDGGMADNPRVALYGARYTAVLANRVREAPDARVTVVGRFCESGDVLLRDTMLPWPRPGDLLAIFSTGAYHYSMASNYNRFPRPAIVFAREGRAELVVERETYDDLVRHDRLPDHLRRRA